MDGLYKPVTKYGCCFYKNLTEGGCQEWILNQTNHGEEVCITINNGEHCRLWGNVDKNKVVELISSNKYLLEILHHYPYKVAFDYDLVEIDKIPDFKETEQLEKVINLIREHFRDAVIAVSGSCCYVKNKYSLHVVLNNYLVHNNAERDRLKCFATYLKTIDGGFDNSIYGRSRQMKLINQTKPNDKRVQKILKDGEPRHHIITAFFPDDALPIPDFVVGDHSESVKLHFRVERAKKPFELSTLPDFDIELPTELADIQLNELTTEQILKLLPSSKALSFEYDHLVARYCYTNGISFETYLSWLKQKHPNIQQTESGLKMWQDLVKFPPAYLNNVIPILDKYYKNLTADKSLIRFKSLFDLNIKTSAIERIEPEHFKVSEKYLLFNCGMGSGKTTQTISFLKTEYNFLWVAPNIALADNTLTRLADEGVECANYQKFKPKEKRSGILNDQQALMVCLNSLAYIDQASFCVVVIDEIETILEKFFGDDNMITKCRDIFDNFIRLLRNANKVIILDAFITNSTLEFIQTILDKGEDIKIYETPVQTNRRVNYVEYKSSVHSIVEKLNNGKKLFIYYPLKKGKQTSKINFPSMEDFFKEVEKQTGKHGYMYNADVDDKIKSTIKNCNDEWATKDFIITNNVITCGVNFDREHFDEVFLFVANFSLPRQIIQVSYRARILRDELINIAYLGEMKAQTTYKINDNVTNPIYKRLINNILTERKAPIRQALEFFCAKAGYKQDYDKTETNAEIETFYSGFTANMTVIRYSDIEDINSGYYEDLKEFIIERKATQKIKLMVRKYQFNQMFKSADEFESEEDKRMLAFWMSTIWDDGLINFINGFKKMKTLKIFDMIYDINKENEDFKDGIIPVKLTKLKLNDEILDIIFDNFRFKNLTRSSKPNKLYMEVINTHFKCEIIKSQYDVVGKRTSY